MVLPLRPTNPNTPIQNNPFYSPETTYFQGPYYPAIADSTSGITVNPNGVIAVTGGGGGGGVSQIIAASGISVSPVGGTGVVTVGNTGVLSLIAGSGISISGSTGNITISSSTSGGTVTNVIGVSPISVVSGTTVPIISIGTASTTTTGVTSLVNNLTTNDNTKALTAAQGYALQQQISTLTVSGGLTLAGTFSASSATLATVTSAGAALPPPSTFVAGSNLPNPAPANNNYFVIVTTPGNYDPPGPGGPYAASQGDWFLSNGTQWSWLNVGFDAPSANTTTAGIVRLATSAEAQTGTDSTIALTPASASATYVPKSCFPTKGTLIAGGPAPNTPTALPLGSAANGYVLTVDLTCSTGLKWAAPTGGGGGTGTVTFVGTGAGLSGGPITTTGSIDLVNRGIAAASYSNPTVTVNCYGIITGISSGGAAIPCSIITGKGVMIAGSAANTPTAFAPGPDGFILAACSLEPSGLCWVTNPASSAAIPCATITGKGALVTGTAANAPTALPAGPNGTFLAANSACACGLEWVLPTNASATPPTGPTIGQLWYDTASTPDVLKAWDGTTWVPVNLTSSTTAPTSPALGQTWVNTSTAPITEYIWNGTAWIPANFDGSPTAPVSPVNGQTWVNTSVTPPVEYIWNGTSWLPTNFTANTTAPLSPILGQTWVNTSLTPPVEFIWNGTSWAPTSNIANTTAPTSPTLGQLWNDTSGSDPVLKSWNGSDWVPYSVVIDSTAPTSPTTGQLWSDTSGVNPVLKVWNGSTWIATGTGTVTSVIAGTGLTGGNITSSGTIALANTAVTAGNYTLANITVDAQGRITAASNGTPPTGTVTCVCTGTGLTGGPFSTTGTIALANTSVTPGTYNYGSFTVDAQGRLTSASSNTPCTGTVTSVTAGTGLTGGSITTSGTLALANTAVTAGSYTYASLTVDAQGRLTAASSGVAPVNGVSGTAPIVVTGTTSPVISITQGSTAACGAVQLYDGRNSTSTALALTANQGKLLQDQIDTLTNSGGLTLAGTLDASTGLLLTVTSAGTTDGFVVGNGLPNATVTTVNDYVIVTVAGSYDPPGAGGPYNASQGDWFVAVETSPGVYQWDYLNVGYDPVYAGTTQCGVVCLSTNALAQAGVDATTALTPAAAASAYIPKACVTAKGALISGTAANTPTALAVGTDGQVLTACSASPTGLCWAAASVPAIPCACVTGKGVLITGTAANTPTALPVGTNGQYLVANSSCSTGLEWATGMGDTPVGTVNWFSTTAAPSGWLVADGSAVSRTTYSTLFGVIGTTFGSGDGSTTFNLPDLRGMFTRGWDAAGGVARGCDVGRVFGTTQGFALQNHCHQLEVSNGLAGRPEWACPNNACPTGASYTASVVGPGVPTAGFTSTNGSSETRPMNVALLPCIKWQVTTAPTSSGIPCSCITAKGTIITGDAPNNPVSLPVGSDGQALVACAACAFGLTWTTPAVPVSPATPTVAGTVKGCTDNVLFNTMLGCNAGVIATGCESVFVGYNAGCSVTTAIRNTVVGACSGQAITAGCFNTILGSATGCGITTSIGNVLLGHAAGRCVTADSNTLVGSDAGFNITAGTLNVALGACALGVPFATPNTGNCNVAIGTGALKGTTTGSVNTAVGTNAGCSITTGCQNQLFGAGAGASLTIGSDNVLVGQLAGGSLISGCNSTFLGGGAGLCSTVGCQTLVGFTAGASITTGAGNTALGLESLGFCGAVTPNTASANVAIGECSLRAITTGGNNTAVGYWAGKVATTACANTLSGWCSGASLTTGSYNALFGHVSGVCLTTGVRNTAVGGGAGQNLVSGSDNSFLGDSAGAGVTTGVGNVAIGRQSLSTVNTGCSNIAIGRCALFNFNGSTSGNVGIGDQSLLNLASGANNTALGSCSGDSLTNGCNNVLIGANAGCSMTTASGTVALGTSAGCSATGGFSVFLGLDAGDQVTIGTNNVVIGPAVQPASLTGSCQLAIGFAAGCCWLTGDSNRNIRPAKGIIDCNGSTGTAGQALSADGSGNLVWGGNYGDTPVGAVNFFAANSVPAGWLAADGSAVSRSIYSALFAVIGTTYGVGDGSTTFNLPDLRGQFVRGFDAAGGSARGCDSGRTFGSNQGFAMQPITGCIAPIAETFSVWGSPQTPTAGNALWRASGFPTAGCTPATVDTSTAGTLCFCSSLVVATACETRPMNVAMLPCIKWQVTSAPSSCGIPCACLTGKGALVTANAAATPIALPAGADNLILTTCSSCSTGLVWAAPRQQFFAARTFVACSWSNQNPIPYWGCTFAIDPGGQFSVTDGDGGTSSTIAMPINKLIRIELTLRVVNNCNLSRTIDFYKLGNFCNDFCDTVAPMRVQPSSDTQISTIGVICTSVNSCAFNWKPYNDFSRATFALDANWISTVLN